MRYETRRGVLNFAATLQNFANLAPDEESKKDINRMVLRLRLRYSDSEEKQKEKVDFAIRHCLCQTEEDICDETGLNEEDVIRYLQALICEGRIRKVKPEGRKASGRGGTRFEYYPIDQDEPSAK